MSVSWNGNLPLIGRFDDRIKSRFIAPLHSGADDSVSVIIPTYNRGNLICETIDSILPQLTEFDEIIVVDDGSTDNTEAALTKYGNRIRYIWQTNSLQPAARNAGMFVARGSFLLFIDSDDLLICSALQRLKSKLQQTPDAPLVYGPAVGFDSNGPRQLDEPQKSVGASDLVRLARVNFIRSPGCVLIRRSAIVSVGTWDVRLPGVEDWDMWIRLTTVGTFAQEHEPVLRYRVHTGNVSLNHYRMGRSWCKMVLKHSGVLSPIRRDAEGHRAFQDIRPRVARLEFNSSLDQYRQSQGSLLGVVKSGCIYAVMPEGVRSLINYILRHTIAR